MRKFAVIIIILSILAGGAAVFSVVSYSQTGAFRSDAFPENTMINGIDCSGLSYEQAADKLTDSWNKRYISVISPLSENLAGFTDFGCEYDIDESLANAKTDNIFSAASNHYLGTQLTVSLPMIVSEYDSEFKERVLASDFFDRKEFSECRNAYVDMTDRSFPIIPEAYGTRPDGDKFFRDILNHIQQGEVKMIFDEKKYYSMPEITSSNKALKKYQAYCLEYLTQTITYDLADFTFTITPEDLESMLADDQSGKVDEKAVRKFVHKLALKYNNIGAYRHLTSLGGKEIEVSGGIYGWEIDEEAETEQLIADIKSRQHVSREPVYSIRGYGAYTDDLGDTYIDVDVTEQKVVLYIDGKNEFTSDCVTGHLANGTTTDIGTFYILNKITDVVLRGDNADGTKYESPVKFWMGINWNGEGLHDANWRNSFGGQIWKYDGSHGCINIPPSRMPELYNKSEVGMPVVVHY